MSILLLSRKDLPRLPPGLQALYSFADGSGQTLSDGSGNGRDGTLGSTVGADTNDPAWVTEGLSFATDDFVDASAYPELLPDQWTLCVAIKHPAGSVTPILGWGSSSFPAVYAAAPFNSNRPLIWLANGCFRYFESASPVNVQDGGWHFLAFRCPGNTTSDIAESSLLVDGQQQAIQSTLANEDGLAKSTLRLGTAGLTYFAQSEMAFLSLHDRVLTDSEVQQMRDQAKLLVAERITLP